MLAITLATMLLIYGGLYAIIAGLRGNVQKLYEDIRADAEQTIEEGLYAQDSDSLGVLADMQMEVTDSRLRIVSDAVKQALCFAGGSSKLRLCTRSFVARPGNTVCEIYVQCGNPGDWCAAG